MDKIAFPNVLVLFASLSLWSVAVQATIDGGRDGRNDGATPSTQVMIENARERMSQAYIQISASEAAPTTDLVPETAVEQRKPQKKRALKETSILSAASGHWF